MTKTKSTIILTLAGILLICVFLLIFVNNSSAGPTPISERELYKDNYQIINTTNVVFDLPVRATHYWTDSSGANDLYEVIISNFSIKGDKNYILRVTWNDSRYVDESLQIHYEFKNGELDKDSIKLYSLSKYDKSCLDEIPNSKNMIDYADCEKTKDDSELMFKDVNIEIGTLEGYKYKIESNRTGIFNVSYPVYSWKPYTPITTSIINKDFIAIDDVNVSACGTLGTNNEHYDINKSIIGDGNCFYISGHNITLDMNGYNVTGPDDSSFIQGEAVESLTIYNGSIINWDSGIFIDDVITYNMHDINFYGVSGDALKIRPVNSNFTTIRFEHPQNLWYSGVNFHAVWLNCFSSSTRCYNNLFKNIYINTTIADTGDNGGIIYDNCANATFQDLIIDSNITTTQINIYSSDPEIDLGTLIFINSTHNSSLEDFVGEETGLPKIIRKWYFQTQVNNSAGYLSGAAVNIYDKDGTLKHSQLTGADGSITRQEVIEYTNNGGTKTYSTPHTVNVSADGHATNSTIYNLTVSKNVMHFVTLAITNTAPIVTLSSPANNSWSKTLTNTLVCNSTDANGNLANATIYTWNSSSYNYNSAPTTTISGSANSTTFADMVFSTIPIEQGAFKWNCYICDSSNACVWATSNFTLNIDTTKPNINIVSPLNNTNTSNSQLNINYTVFDTNLNSCWWTKNNGGANTSINCGVNITGQTWGEGLNNVTIFVNDSANNINSSSVTFRLDTIKPAINIVYPLALNYSINISALNYTVGDATLTSCWYSINNGLTNTSVTCGNNLTSLTSTEGTNNWLVGANDSVGNSNMSKVTFFKDTVYPLISYGVGTESTNTNFSRNWIYVNTSWTELNLANITFYLYNATSIVNTTIYTTSTYFINFTNLIDGNYTYEVNITDTVNNKNRTGIRRITIDDTPPTINIIYPINGNTYSGPTIGINYTISDNLIGLSSCWYTNNSGLTNHSIACGNNLTETLADNPYTYIIYSNDTLNNLGFSSITFTLSSVAPATNLNNPTNNKWLNYTNNILFNFTSTDANGISACQLWGNWTNTWHKNQTLTSVTSGVQTNFNLLNLTAGTYKWNVWCNDTLNNGQFSANNFTFSLDTTYPLISYGTGTQNSGVNLSQSNIYINVTFTELNFANITFNLYNDAGVVYSNDYLTAIYERNWTGLSNGNYSYFVNITDKANNKNSTGIRYITLDTVAPNATLIFPTNNTYNKTTSQNFTSNLTDNLGIKNVTLYIYNETGEYNKTVTSFAPSTTQKLLGIVVNVVNGIYKWWVSLWDWSGNTYSTENNTLIIDTIFPSVIDNGYTPTLIYNDNDVVIFANVSDTYLNTVWLRINFTGTYQNITVTNKVGNTYNYTISNTVIDNFENISWYWYANDTVNNVNSSFNSFLVSNRNPYDTNITLPINNSYVKTSSLIINFSSIDPDGDTLNYSLYNSTDGITFSLFSSTTSNWVNFTSYNFTDGVIHYIYATANDSQLQNSSSVIQFNIDNINPNLISIDLPKASPTPICSVTNIALNYSVSDTNLDYCEFKATVGGLDSTPLTRINGCVNTTFNVIFDNSIQTFTFWVYDKAGNVNSTSFLIYVNSGNTICLPPVTPPPGAGAGTGSGTPPVAPTNATWSMTTETGSKTYQIYVSPGTLRTKQLLFNNLATTPNIITLDCQGELCGYINITPSSFTLPVGVGIPTQAKIDILLPKEFASNGTYTVNIIATDKDKATRIVTLQISVSSFAYVQTLRENLLGLYPIGGIQFPIALIVFIPVMFLFIILWFTLSKYIVLGRFLTVLISIITYIVLIFIF